MFDRWQFSGYSPVRLFSFLIVLSITPGIFVFVPDSRQIQLSSSAQNIFNLPRPLSIPCDCFRVSYSFHRGQNSIGLLLARSWIVFVAAVDGIWRRGVGWDSTARQCGRSYCAAGYLFHWISAREIFSRSWHSAKKIETLFSKYWTMREREREKEKERERWKDR